MKNCAHCPYQFNNGTYEYPESACIPQLINEDVFLNEDGCKLHHAELKRLHRLYDAVEDAYCCGFNEEERKWLEKAKLIQEVAKA